MGLVLSFQKLSLQGWPGTLLYLPCRPFSTFSPCKKFLPKGSFGRVESLPNRLLAYQELGSLGGPWVLADHTCN